MACGGCTGTCSGSCSAGCTTCSGCTGVCDSSCGSTCSGTCSGGCTSCSGCSSCSGTCSGNCSGTCSGGCSGCSGSCSGGCTGGCSGCSGCSACSGTCSGTCNNACSSSSASSTIANLGSNIKNYGFITQNDFKDLLNAVVGEYNRRGYSTSGKYTAFSATPAQGVAVLVEHAQKVFYDVNNYPSSGKTYAINSTNIVKASDITSCIAYIQSLMNQNIVN